jgi:hypothetical protein
MIVSMVRLTGGITIIVVAMTFFGRIIVIVRAGLLAHQQSGSLHGGRDPHYERW